MRKVIEALTPKGSINPTEFKEGQTLTLKKDLYYGFLDTLFDYFECNNDVAEAVRDFTGKAKPVIMGKSVMFVVPKGTKLYLDTFRPGRDEVFVRIWGILCPLTIFVDMKKNKEVYWDDEDIKDWVG